MKDSIEDFVKKHRSEFDDLEPRASMWDQIESQLDQNKEIPIEPKRNYLWMWKAAAVVFVCMTIGLLVERNWYTNDSTEVAEVQKQSEDIEQVESYYSGLIEKRKAEIRLAMERKDMVDEELLSDLDGLDSMYQDLKNELKRNKNNEKVVNAMIRNLQLRVEILNKQLEILDQLVKYEEDEKISI
ncbi:hypothetical protein [Reichenbachiella ulvae]|uniref:Anti-sigma factor n=1 Tax=Reichenbachiella ulvae TaxID=2980104 RepID=A0ABT3CTH9_9BACT|nr:hypothetical protein [Reichenbachiella ulvae]MCV9386924.1 hypothetical protein [Reichenbachiella ulvae]